MDVIFMCEDMKFSLESSLGDWCLYNKMLLSAYRATCEYFSSVLLFESRDSTINNISLLQYNKRVKPKNFR